MSALDDAIALVRGVGYGDIIRAAFTKVRDDLASLVASGVTASVVYESREVSSAVDITLVAADSVLQSVTMTAASKAVILPDATTCVEGRPRIIVNAGTNDFAIKKNGGAVLVAAVAAAETYVLRLLDGATAAGEWHIPGAMNLQDGVLTRPVFKDYGEADNALGSVSGAVEIDYEDGNVVSLTMTGAITLTVVKWPASGTAGSLTLYITNGGSAAWTWPAATKWPSGTAPSLTASGRDVIGLTTLDAGTIIDGFDGGLDRS